MLRHVRRHCVTQGVNFYQLPYSVRELDETGIKRSSNSNVAVRNLVDCFKTTDRACLL